MKLFIFLVIGIVLISGCANLKTEKPGASASPSKSPVITGQSSPSPALKSPAVTQQPSPVKAESSQSPTTAQEPLTESYDSPPLISSTSLNPSNPSLGDPISLSITATDDKGLEKISWQSSIPFSNAGSTDSYNCKSQSSCSYRWEFLTNEEGLYQVTVSAIDSSGKEAKTNFDVNVGPASVSKTSSPTPSPTATAQSSPSTTSSSSECSSNSDCGYKKICTSGTCQAVDCTSDSHCSGCKKCSGNRCVSCGYGPYGCYC